MLCVQHTCVKCGLRCIQNAQTEYKTLPSLHLLPLLSRHSHMVHRWHFKLSSKLKTPRCNTPGVVWCHHVYGVALAMYQRCWRRYNANATAYTDMQEDNKVWELWHSPFLNCFHLTNYRFIIYSFTHFQVSVIKTIPESSYSLLKLTCSQPNWTRRMLKAWSGRLSPIRESPALFSSNPSIRKQQFLH